jgi:hypothetical protein
MSGSILGLPCYSAAGAGKYASHPHLMLAGPCQRHTLGTIRRLTLGASSDASGTEPQSRLGADPRISGDMAFLGPPEPQSHQSRHVATPNLTWLEVQMAYIRPGTIPEVRCCSRRVSCSREVWNPSEPLFQGFDGPTKRSRFHS